jgi:hypothetical protein
VADGRLVFQRLDLLPTVRHEFVHLLLTLLLLLLRLTRGGAEHFRSIAAVLHGESLRTPDDGIAGSEVEAADPCLFFHTAG